MRTDNLARLIESHHGAHLYCHVLIDPLATAHNGDHAVLAQLRNALGEHALTRVHRDDLAHAPQLHPVLACLASPGTVPSRCLLELTARAAQKALFQQRRYLCGCSVRRLRPLSRPISRPCVGYPIPIGNLAATRSTNPSVWSCSQRCSSGSNKAHGGRSVTGCS